MTIKELRISKNLTQTEAANLTGLSLRTYQNYEYENSTRDLFKINHIINILSHYERYTENTGIYTIEEIKSILSKILNTSSISYVYLFGSYSKNEANEKSDIDFLISDEVKGLEFIGLYDEIKKAFNKQIDLIRIDSLKENFAFLNEILKTAIKVYEKH